MGPRRIYRRLRNGSSNRGPSARSDSARTPGLGIGCVAPVPPGERDLNPGITKLEKAGGAREAIRKVIHMGVPDLQSPEHPTFPKNAEYLQNPQRAPTEHEHHIMDVLSRFKVVPKFE